MEEELPYEGEGIDFGESAPQTERDDHTYNPEEENAGEEADEVQGNEQSQSKSTTNLQPLHLPQSPLSKKSRLQYQANHPPPKYEENRILVLPQNLRSPFEHGTQVKGVLNRYAKLYTTRLDQPETRLGPRMPMPRGSYSTQTSFLIFTCRDSVYPIGSPTRASEFFKVFLKRRQWLEDELGDLTFDTYLALSFYRLRFQEHPSMFPSTKIAIMNVAFQMLWSHQYENWKANESLPGRTFFYYYGLAPRYAETMRCHWVAMVICIPDRTVKIYDSGSPVRGNVQLRKAAEAFARMVPFALWFLAEEEHKPSVDRTDFKIKCISKGVPRAKNP
ncbi:hypothetical protein Bca52824_048462 [Brassica carinata]|uniref:Ubiquitin-like protease family profile domain-containing protein n=1 Tax=Brassica carinata TaxID=52824 RepID=A0A8X7RKZ9_BRACI|nr:hypothetical protein Bca52824_048462 [Brassica carinata]